MTVSFRTRVNLGFFVAVVFLGCLSFYSYRSTKAFIQNSRWVSHTHEVIAHIETIFSDVKELEASQRGFLLTADPDYLDIIDTCSQTLAKSLQSLAQLVPDNPVQQQRVVKISELISERMRYLKGIVRVRQNSGVSEAIQTLKLGKGKQISDEFRALTAQMKQDELSLLKTRTAEADASSERTLEVVLFGGILAFLLIFGCVLVINRAENERIQSKNQLELSNRLKTALNELSVQMQGEQSTQVLCTNILSYFAKALNAPTAAFYLNRSDKYKFLAGYAYRPSSEVPDEFLVGQGLVGQAAQEKRALAVSGLPKHYLKVSSALGETVANHILVLPLIFEKQVIAVVEFGKLEPFSSFENELLESALPSVTIGVLSAENRARAAELLATTQAQGEEMAAQQEELRQTNEELEEQGEVLRQSEEELKRQAEQLKQSNEELEEHTRLLSQKNDEIASQNSALEQSRSALQESVSLANEATRAKSMFLANMSHELRTPLNSILLLSDVLSQNRNQNLLPKQVEFATTIHRSGSDLLNLINDILDLSKVEAGKLELNLEEILLSDIVEAAHRNFQFSAQTKGIDFKIEVDPSLPAKLITDRMRLEQILKNLLGNAFKFTEKGAVSLQISPSDKLNEAAGEAISFSITDTGCGIAKSKQNLVFEAFKQADGTISRKYGGSGLGLSISKELARLLGGTIQFESEEGKGSKFVLVVPQKPAQHVTPEAARKILSLDIDRSTTARPTSSKDILIIEDDPSFSQVLADLVDRMGYSSHVAATGSEGVDLLMQYLPRAVLLDLRLPDIDGLEILQWISANSKTAHIPVQVITGTDRQAEAMRAGAVGYLSKPVTSEKIETTLRKLVKSDSASVPSILIHSQIPEVRKIQEHLLNQGVATQLVANGDEALKLLQTQPYGALVIGSQLKDMATIDFLAKIRENAELRRLPVIIYTEEVLNAATTDAFHRYAQSIIVRGTKSIERLLDEVRLFLHSLNGSAVVEAKTTEPKKEQELLKGAKVLLVDDDTRNVYAMLSVLEEAGMQVTVAKNGKECLEQLGKQPDVQLVLMDIMMPEMDGYEATRRIRKEEKFVSLPIIALTAKAMKEDRAKCMEAGANDYLSKPVDMNKLLSMMAVWLGASAVKKAAHV